MSNGDKKTGWAGVTSLFSRSSAAAPTAIPSAIPTASLAVALTESFRPQKGTFFQTQEYPVPNETGEVIGREWFEATYVKASDSWILWKKSVVKRADDLTNEMVYVVSSSALMEKTSFVTAFDQMVTFEEAQKSLGIAPLTNKTPMKLGGDYFRQFAWREGLIISRSGRLYPYRDGETPTASNTFDGEEMKTRSAFIERARAEEFVPIPLVVPSVNWDRAYAADKDRVDTRLAAVKYRYQNDRDNFDLAMQVVSNEDPAVLWAHLQSGFAPQIFHTQPDRHFALVKAAIDRDNIEVIDMLSHAGIGFYVRHDNSTPMRHALRNRRYSHIHAMLSRDGATLANFTSEDGAHPSTDAITLQDRQAFLRLAMEKMDYTYTDPQGWQMVHHGFAHDFRAAIYAWLGENLNIDAPIAGTAFTGLSIAKANDNKPLVQFAIQRGANSAVAAYTPPVPELPPATAAVEGQAPLGAFAQKVAATLGDQNVQAELVGQIHSMVIAKETETLTTALKELAQLRQQSSDISAKTDDLVRAIGETPLPSKRSFILHLLNSDYPNEAIENIVSAYAAAGGPFNLVGAAGETVWETCWKNQKAKPEYNRRSLIPVFGKLADPAAQLSDGTTQLTRAAGTTVFDTDFIKALAPFAHDANQSDARGNNVLHALQLNSNDQVVRSSNFEAIAKLFPVVDLNQPNKDGYSNVGLAIRLDRPQTLKLLVAKPAIDLCQITESGWSYFDIAFTKACEQAKVTGAPKANKIITISDATRDVVIEAISKPAHGEQGDKLKETLNRVRPDDKTLLTAMIEDETPSTIVRRVVKAGIKADQADGRSVDPRQLAFETKRADLIAVVGRSDQPIAGASTAQVIPFLPTRENPPANATAGSPAP